MKKKFLATLLVASISFQAVVPNVNVQANDVDPVIEKATANVDEVLASNLTLEENKDNLDQNDDDNDGLVNYWEDSIKTDKTNPDTDGDGLTDYEEVALCGTDPLVADTDGNGISDADEDADGDGLSNREEMKYGCNPLKADTDNDGLTDYEEIFVYHTDATVFDSDGDYVSDGFEVEMALAGQDAFDPNEASDEFTYTLYSEDEQAFLEVTAEGSVVESISFEATAEGVYEVTGDGEFEGTLNVVSDEAAAVALYSLDEENETELMTEEETVVDADVASIEVTSAGTYALFDRDEILNQIDSNIERIIAEHIDIVELEDGTINTCPKGFTDMSGDGICDILVTLMYTGIIRTGDNQKVFDTKKYTLMDVLKSNDWDNDGLMNGEELSLKMTKKGFVYAVFTTSPVNADTDGDGILDNEDTAPLENGLAGGIIGSLQMVGSHDPNALFTAGHAFLVYTSYTDNQVFALKAGELNGSYDFTEEGKKAAAEDILNLSWRSVVSYVDYSEEDAENVALRKALADKNWTRNKEEKSFELNRGEYITIGNFTNLSFVESLKTSVLGSKEAGTLVEYVALQAIYEAITGEKVDVVFIMSHINEVIALVANRSYVQGEDILDGVVEDGGIWVNREMYDQSYQYDQYPHEIYEVEITQAEFDRMVETLNENSYYNSLNHNCTSVAALAWNEAVGYETTESGAFVVDENGNRVKSGIYMNSRGKGLLSIMDFPGAVCESIQELKDIEGLRGQYYSYHNDIVCGVDVKDKYIFGVSVNGSSSVAGTIGNSTTVAGSDNAEKQETEDAAQDTEIVEDSEASIEDTAATTETVVEKKDNANSDIVATVVNTVVDTYKTVAKFVSEVKTVQKAVAVVKKVFGFFFR